MALADVACGEIGDAEPGEFGFRQIAKPGLHEAAELGFRMKFEKAREQSLAEEAGESGQEGFWSAGSHDDGAV